MNRYNLIFLIIFFTFLLPGLPSTPIASDDQNQKLNLFKSHLHQSFELLQNSSFNHNYGNLTGFKLSYQDVLDGDLNQTYPLPGKDYNQYRNNQRYSILPDEITDLAQKVWDLDDVTTKESNYFTNITSKLKGGYILNENKSFEKLPLEIPGYLLDFKNDPIGSNYPEVPPNKIGNITHKYGSVNLDLSIVEKSNNEYFNSLDSQIKLIKMVIETSDELEYEKNSIETVGFYFVDSGNIITSTNSAKFFSIYGGLQHLTLNEKNFELTKNVTISYLQRELFGRTDRDSDDDGEIDVDLNFLSRNIDKSEEHCEYISFSHINKVNLTKNEISEIDQELRSPIGRPIDFNKIPNIQLQGFMYSPDCAIEIDFPSVIGMKHELQMFRLNKAVIAGIGLLLVQILLLVRQMSYSSTPSTIARISFYTIWIMSLVDGSLAMLYLIGSAIFNKLYSPLIVSAFLSFILASIFEIRFLISIYVSQYNERTLTLFTALQGRPTDEEQTQQTNPPPAQDESQVSGVIYTRFFFSLMIFTFLLLNSVMWPKTLRSNFEKIILFALNSYWLPQAYRNTIKGSHRSFKWWFIGGTTLVRLVPIFYIFVVKSNVFEHHYDLSFFMVIFCWLILQITLLIFQGIFGARFFLPKKWLPKTYDYHPILSESDLENGFGIGEGIRETNNGHVSVDCAICMEPVEVQFAKSNLDQVTGFGQKKQWMITPCHHVFHTDCLERHMRYKLQCPICRSALPPP
ncbi:hypothetical protein WICMUC_005047 [Wickerhamomyces mucosus]|uniref:RING-type E3 ubiquitin transferase n=1 Tax=Wickerhamomyces mucosus TaxID=1378264 RepID=A0A9P8PBJ4_9ASCO|nr:hypothetical protein WICMUC_005047 [Wickerhamomyces mucosus]